MPCGKAAMARSALKSPAAFWMAPLPSQMPIICATFSSSVIRPSRSSTRRSTGREASR